MPFGSRSIGIAMSDTQLVATIPSGNGNITTREWALDPYSRLAIDWPSLAHALGELRTLIPASKKLVTITLAPPLVQVRRVDLPKLDGVNLRAVLSRSAVRFFPGVREAVAVGATILENTSPSPYLAAATPSRMLDVVIRAVRDAGWEINTVVPIHAAWAAAALRRWPVLKDGVGRVNVPFGSHSEVLQLEDGKIQSVRRFLSDDIPPHERTHTLDRPMETAALAAHQATGPEILPEVEYVRRAAARRKVVARTLMGVAAAALLAAAGFLVKEKRELKSIMEERAHLRASVSQVTTGQLDIATLTGPVTALEKIETRAPVWSEVFADVSSNLPRDAYLMSFKGREDSVSAEGLATRGAAVFESMAGAKLLDSVRSSGPIRRQIRQGSKPMDQFTLSAAVLNAVPLYAAHGRKQP